MENPAWRLLCSCWQPRFTPRNGSPRQPPNTWMNEPTAGLVWSGRGKGPGNGLHQLPHHIALCAARPALGGLLGETAAGPAEKKLIENVKQRVAHWERIVTVASDVKDPLVPFYQGQRRRPALGTEAVLNSLCAREFRCPPQ